MASMRDIKRRKNSITSTGQITKAMKLVATAKLQKAKIGVAATRPYFNYMHSTISSILSSSTGISHPYLEEREGNKNVYIVMTSNTGLAGGYNGNICKLVYNTAPSTEDASIIAVGRKGRDIFKRMGYNIIHESNEIVEMPIFSDAVELGNKVLELYAEKQVDQVYIAYTHFESIISQETKLLKVLPLSREEFTSEEDDETKSVMTYEPSAEEVLDVIIPKYISSLIYGALKESVTSEHGARMTAMDSATKNANEMIDDLSLQYNRARQASITQELSEIVGGAEALK